MPLQYVGVPVGLLLVVALLWLPLRDRVAPLPHPVAVWFLLLPILVALLLPWLAAPYPKGKVAVLLLFLPLVAVTRLVAPLGAQQAVPVT